MIGEYRIKKVLGQGGFGITYLAYDEALDRNVAIKEYFPKEFAYRETDGTVIPNQNDQDKVDFEWGMNHFVQEARSLTRFKHRNIVGAIRFIRQNGTAYLVMEHCDGESLESFAKERGGVIPENVLRPIISQLLDGLAEVHRSRLLHLDIKPSNIFIKNDGTVVLLDFGSARQAISSHTKSVKVASAGYGAIEQESADIDAGKLGPWTDIYGLGATLYRLMTSHRPVQATARLLQESLPDLAVTVSNRYSAELVRAVMASIAIRPHERPQSIEDFRRLLGEGSSIQAAAIPSHREKLVEEETKCEPTPTPSTDKESESSWIVSPVVMIPSLLALMFLLGWLFSDKGEDRYLDADGTAPIDISDVREEDIDEQLVTQNNRDVSVSSEKVQCPAVTDTSLYDSGRLPWNDCYGRLTTNVFTFDGYWMNGKKSKGTETYEEFPGTKYVGEFRDNFRHGRGTLTSSNGFVYNGQWRKGNYHGQGRATYTGGSFYEGAWVDGKRQGEGTLRFPDGKTASGQWKNDVLNGMGTITWSNGDKLVGNFVNGKVNGMGEYSWSSGAKFVGEYKNDLKNGVGEYSWSSGAKFVGEYKNDLKNGDGTLTYPDGSKFIGVWENDERNGRGTEYGLNGEVLRTGIWINGKYKESVNERDLYIDVQNSLSRTIRYIYVKKTTEISWGRDRLGQTEVLKVGGTFRVRLPKSTELIFDVRLCDGNRDEYVYQSVNAEQRNVTATVAAKTGQKCWG